MTQFWAGHRTPADGFPPRTAVLLTAPEVKVSLPSQSEDSPILLLAWLSHSRQVQHVPGQQARGPT